VSPSKGPKAEREKERKGRSPEHQRDQGRGSTGRQESKEANPAKQKKQATQHAEEQRSRHPNTGQEKEGKGPAEERPTTHTSKRSGDDLPQATRQRTRHRAQSDGQPKVIGG